ncbi:hypothetical protein [Aeromicrobium sp. UC242_57]|uniref:hypothetical protein n=1 Tax=Aeromicrobium sp. UC242_57 TaxID=3374624 RepID=UPI0037BA6FF1
MTQRQTREGVAIVGAAESDLGVTDKSILTLQAQAVTRALADAGLTLTDVDGLATTGISRFSATQLADYFAIQPTWTDSTFAGGSAYEMMIARAAQAIDAGQATTIVISFASNQRSARSRKLGGVHEPHIPEAQFEEPYDMLFPASYYAMAMQQYLHRFGGTHEQARRDRRCCEGVGAAQPEGVPLRQGLDHGRRHHRVDDAVEPADGRRLLSRDRRRRSGRADVARTRPRPAAHARRGAGLRRADDQHVVHGSRRPHCPRCDRLGS